MTPFQKFCAIFIVVVLLILSGGLGYKIGHRIGYKKGYSDALNEPHKADTIWRYDTEYVDKPVPYYIKPSGVEMYPIGTLADLQKQIDSLSAVSPDTAYVEIPVPIESALYGGQPGDEYKAQVSGWHPSLDWIEVYPKTAYITNTIVEKKRWSFSITGGLGFVWDVGDKKVHGGPGVVGGVSYNF